MADTRTEKITSTQDIYDGTSWRCITDAEHILIIKTEISLLSSIRPYVREFATRDAINQLLIEKLVKRYPEEKAEEGFYQVITFNGQPSFAIHPLAMDIFDQLACWLHRAARTLKPNELEEYYRTMIGSLKDYLKHTYGIK